MKALLIGITIVIAAGMGWYAQEHYGSSSVRTAAPPAPYLVELAFDGGYAIIRDNYDPRTQRATSFTVAAFDSPATASSKTGMGMSMPSHHPMSIQVHQGNYAVVGNAQPTNAALKQWMLNDKDYQMTIEGLSGGVAMAAPGSYSNCDSVAADQVDNTAFTPVMGDLLRKPSSTTSVNYAIDESKLRNRVTISGGTFGVDHLSSCFEYMVGATSYGRQPIAGGLGGVKIWATMPDSSQPVTIHLTGGDAIRLLPQPRQGITKLAVRFQRIPACPQGGCTLDDNTEVVDFGRYYTLLVTPPAAAARLALWKRYSMQSTTPGEECPPVIYDKPGIK